jgi:hypothetical protein
MENAVPDGDPYQVLGVAPTASARELRRAYHRLSQQWHPDHHMQAGPAALAVAEAAFKRINHAYVVACQTLEAGPTPTPVQVQQRTRQEEQLATVAHVCTSARLMMVAQYWGLNPYTYRREVELVRRILADAVVFGARAFPRGFARELPSILIEQALATEEAHVRALLTEAMQVILDRAPDEEVAAWQAIFAPLGHRPPASSRAVGTGNRKAKPASSRGAPARALRRPRPRRGPRLAAAAAIAVAGLLIALAGLSLAAGLLPPWTFVGVAVVALLSALALVLIP